MRKLNLTKEEQLEKRRKYDAEYRAKNREKLAEYQKQWRKDNPEKEKARKARFYQSHKNQQNESDEK